MAVIMFILTVGLLSAPLVAEAQPAGKIARIGVLRTGAPPDPNVEAFRQGLRELGYVEGQTVTLSIDGPKGGLTGFPAWPPS